MHDLDKGCEDSTPTHLPHMHGPDVCCCLLDVVADQAVHLVQGLLGAVGGGSSGAVQLEGLRGSAAQQETATELGLLLQRVGGAARATRKPSTLFDPRCKGWWGLASATGRAERGQICGE